MKALVLGSDDRLALATTEVPTPGPGEVLIRVRYAGLQWGDVLAAGGHFPLPRPFVPGFEAAGNVVAVGEGVDAARIGRPVTALTASGAFAEFVTAPAVLAFPAEDLDLRTAAAFGWATPTAYDLINNVTRVRAGDRVLIHAALGGVGSLAAQFARAAGAARVVGVGGGPEQAASAPDFGYDQLIPRTDFPGALADEQFDVILDPVGGPARLAHLDRLAPHGRLALYGNMATFEPVRLDANDLLMNGTSVLAYNSNLLSRTHPERLAASATEALRLLADRQVHIDISAAYELADVPTAIRRLAAGGTRGKAVVRIG
ncbi:zinc-binding alcohol dehydrogenase family protein [Streptomyces sp. NPDC053493]|uniref:zinc-binding alcohol dehydrogenase family protein n=1 Tax=Streptomyces sp. NPDC053493 TaxID=3365705 RepID=UPI0037D5026D